MAIDPTKSGAVTSTSNADAPGGAPLIDATQLAALQELATDGAVPLLDLRRTPRELVADPNLAPDVRSDIGNALDSMRDLLAEGPTNADAGRSLEWIGSLNPFARARADLSVA